MSTHKRIDNALYIINNRVIMRSAKIATSLVIVCATLLAALSLLLPLPANSEWWAFHAYMAITLATAAYYVGASTLFIKGLRGFTPRLKRAYATLCFGASLLGVAFVTLPLVSYGGTIESVIRGPQLTAIAFLVALTCIYAGTRSFAKLFAIRNITISWWFAFIPPVVMGVLYGLLPHVPTATPEIQFDMGNAFNIFSMWMTALAMLHILQVKQKAGPLYTNALAWLILTFGIMLVAVIGHLLLVLPLGDEQWFLIGAVPFIPLLVASLCFLRAAYAFNAITISGDVQDASNAERNFFGRPKKHAAGSNITSIDIVTFAANLVSEPLQIGSILDKIRAITIHIDPQQRTVSSEDEKILRQLYLDIEIYLLEKEKLREFTQQSLRQHIARSLHLSDRTGTFWDSL